jgi:dual specificity tyrosine-phosphorylation-regulated kinase 2/3/4
VSLPPGVVVSLFPQKRKLLPFVNIIALRQQLSTESTPIAIPPCVDHERNARTPTFRRRPIFWTRSCFGGSMLMLGVSKPLIFSHLPPSPCTTSIHQFLKHSGSRTTPPHRPSSSSNKELPHSHTSPNVSHFLLRGTQEGWSCMDDDAHVEALPKLDGVSEDGKISRR